MKHNRWFLLICAVYLIGFFSHAFFLKKTVYGDGIFYYSWLRSVVIDKNLNFADEYAHFHVQQTGNKYAVGPALLWLPTFLWTNTLLRGDGYGFMYQVTTGVTTVLFVLTGFVLLFRLLAHYISPSIGAISIMATAYATNLFFYGSLDTVNSHGLSFFTACLYLSFLLAKKKNFFLIGLSLGLIGLIRMQDLIYGILLVPFIKPKNILPIFLGFFAVFSLQLFAWQALYGQFWISPYIAGGEGFNFLRPHILEVLFSPTSGLLFWTPILIFGLAGLLRLSVIRPGRIHRLFLIVLLLQVYVVASWSTWWQGASYGGRMFVSILPIITFGIAHIFHFIQTRGLKPQHTLLLIISPLTMLNILFILFFLLRG